MRAFLSLIFLILIGNLSFSQNAKTSVQKGIDMKKYETFTITQGEVVTGEDSKMDKEQFYKDFTRIVTLELEAKGYTFLSDTTAQLTISYIVEISRVIESENVGPLGQMPQRSASDVQTQTWSRDFNRGSLIIAIEAGKNNQVWTSEGTMDVARTRGGNVLEYAIKNALRDFPDKLKKDKKRKRNKKG